MKRDLEHGICTECGTGFAFLPRGRDQVTCSEPCRATRRSRQANVRRANWLRRQIAAAAAQQA